MRLCSVSRDARSKKLNRTRTVNLLSSSLTIRSFFCSELIEFFFFLHIMRFSSDRVGETCILIFSLVFCVSYFVKFDTTVKKNSPISVMGKTDRDKRSLN